MSTAEQKTVSPTIPTSRRGEPAWELAMLFPDQGEWTEEEYLALDTNRLIELSDGCLEFLPMPTIFHQLIAKFLFGVLNSFVVAHTSGEVLFAPLPVYLWKSKFREPDLVFLKPERLANLYRGQPRSADLVMEVVSEGAEDRERDLVIKREEYAQAGIAEYWIVDPQEQQITVLTLEGNAYRVHGQFGLADRATSVLLPGFSVAVADGFAAAQVNQ
jgi:Uma2 family endonuclease